MEIVFILIPLSILLLAIAVGIFFWAVNNGQFDDMDSPAWRILAEERERHTEESKAEEREAEETTPAEGDRE